MIKTCMFAAFMRSSHASVTTHTQNTNTFCTFTMPRLSSSSVLACVAVATLLAAAQAVPTIHWQDVSLWPFERYVAAFNRPVTKHTPEYFMRETLYEVGLRCAHV